MELQLVIAEKPEGVDFATNLQRLFDSASPYLSPAALTQLRSTWFTGDPPQPPQRQYCSWQFEALQPAAPRDVVPVANRPFGMNLIGHVFEMFGIGEDIRMAARALQAVICTVAWSPTLLPSVRPAVIALSSL